MIFKVRMLSDEDDNFFRDYALPYDMTLAELHRFICRDLGFDPENIASFFASDREWNKGREFTLIDMGFGDPGDPQAPLPMESALLSQIFTRSHDRLIYLFDMLEERALYLELTGTGKAEEQGEYPATTGANGPAPGQFGARDSGGGSIFDEAMGDFSDFAGDDGYDDE